MRDNSISYIIRGQIITRRPRVQKLSLLRLVQFVSFVCISLTADGPQRAKLPLPPTATLPSWPVVTKLPSLPRFSPTNFYRDASSALLHLVNRTIGCFLLTHVLTLSATEEKTKTREVILSVENRTHESNQHEILRTVNHQHYSHGSGDEGNVWLLLYTFE